MTTASILHKKRLASAKASHGISGVPIYRMVLAHLKEMKSDCELLEFGAGTGSLLRQICESGFRGNITAVDIQTSPDHLPTHVSWLQSDLNDPIAVRDNSFDLIVSTEVIEHLENPRAIFREFYRVLRPSGKLIVTTPNQESIRAFASLLLKGHFVAFLDSCYPAHITALLRKDFERICSETGFEKPQFVYTNSGGIPRIPRILWQNITFNLLKGRLFSDNVMVVTSKPTVSTAPINNLQLHVKQ